MHDNPPAGDSGPKTSMMPRVQSFSRLMWPLYVFAVTWVVLPVYATVFARILPLSDIDVDRFLVVVVALVGVVAWWSGTRGGPLLMSEAQVLLGLSSGRSLPTRVAVLRQALFVGGFLGLGAAWLTAMATGGYPEVAHSAQRTLLGIEVGVSVVSLAVLWNLDGHSWLDRGAGVVITALIVAAAITGATAESQLGPLGLLALLALALAVVRAQDVRLDRLWARSLVLAELQFGAALLDFRSALASLRSSRDGPRIPRGRPRPGRLPVWLWRPLRSLAGSPPLVFARVAIMAGGVALAMAALAGTSARLAAMAGVLAVGAVDLTMPLASVLSRPLLHRSSRIPAQLTFAAESAVGMLLTLAVGLAGFAIVSRLPGALHIPEVIAVAVAAGGSSVIQARLGNPDIGAMIDRYGPQYIRGGLAMRSAIPVALLILTVGAVAGLTEHWQPALAGVVASGWIVVLAATTRKAES